MLYFSAMVHKTNTQITFLVQSICATLLEETV